jgi:hypothetical protein
VLVNHVCAWFRCQMRSRRIISHTVVTLARMVILLDKVVGIQAVPVTNKLHPLPLNYVR